MTLTQGNLVFVLSGGQTGATNTNPFNSYGGAVTQTQIQPDSMNNLWSDPEQTDIIGIGVEDYRCVYLVNNSTSDDAQDVRFWWPVKNGFMSAETNRQGANIVASLLPNAKFKPPATEVGTAGVNPLPFTRDTDRYTTTGLKVPLLHKNGGFIAIWLRRIIPQNQPSTGEVISELKGGGN